MYDYGNENKKYPKFLGGFFVLIFSIIRAPSQVPKY